MLRELRILTYYDSAILNQIRMGYLTLKSDKPWLNKYQCNCDGQVPLTVKHFLLDCKLPNVVQFRDKLRTELIRLDPQFQSDEHFYNVQHLLYPHLQYNSKELKTFENLILRSEHLRWVIQYCRYRFPD